jgi:hypothetical protein
MHKGVLFMSVSRFVPPIDYLQTASRSSLQSFELARLNHAANLKREISILMDQWIDETSEAMLARWMLEHHSSLHQPSLPASDLLCTSHAAGADPFPEFPHPPADIHPAPPRFGESPHPSTGTHRGKPRK